MPRCVALPLRGLRMLAEPWSLKEVETFLQRYCDAAVKQYVQEKLPYQFAVSPDWRFCSALL